MCGHKAKAEGALAATLAIGMMGTAVLADLPDDRIVTYNVREDPNDEESPIIFTVDLGIMAYDMDGDTVRWFVKYAVLTETDNSESPPVTTTWSEDEPNVDTSDGYWTIEHDDVEIGCTSHPARLTCRGHARRVATDNHQLLGHYSTLEPLVSA